MGMEKVFGMCKTEEYVYMNVLNMTILEKGIKSKKRKKTMPENRGSSTSVKSCELGGEREGKRERGEMRRREGHGGERERENGARLCRQFGVNFHNRPSPSTSTDSDR
ncbi:hypothetical protein PoB_004521000 [Plakobranchus ocellatus]|uniref:Uncharacterized protein n=1 Tax=Plakobranchus ocellatus TaxID=259542 RepID=A0AAV4BHY8_9GAST|nr:hypothetical protein PoB_004521000 [Plakobranchus ocellatus]